jgi:hypothetical protein
MSNSRTWLALDHLFRRKWKRMLTLLWKEYDRQDDLRWTNICVLLHRRNKRRDPPDGSTKSKAQNGHWQKFSVNSGAYTPRQHLVMVDDHVLVMKPTYDRYNWGRRWSASPQERPCSTSLAAVGTVPSSRPASWLRVHISMISVLDAIALTRLTASVVPQRSHGRSRLLVRMGVDRQMRITAAGR